MGKAEQVARHRYAAQIATLEGHKCPAWEALPDMLRQHLTWLASLTMATG
jgi:hypothetical protein